MKRPIRHIWDDGSTHGAVAGDEYDLVWDYVEQLEAEVEKWKDIANEEHAQSAHTAMRNGELEGEVERLKRLVIYAGGILAHGTPGSAWIDWTMRVQGQLGMDFRKAIYDKNGHAIPFEELTKSVSDLPRVSVSALKVGGE